MDANASYEFYDDVSMVFPTQYSEHIRFVACPGTKEKVTYEGRYDERGVLKLVPTGKINTYQEIQSHKDSCDINMIVKRFAAGDQTALSKVQGLYGDVTEFPKTYADMLNTVINGEKRFNMLPVEVKQKFDNNYAAFVAGIGTKEWSEKLGFNRPVSNDGQPAAAPSQPVVEESVTTNE